MIVQTLRRIFQEMVEKSSGVISEALQLNGKTEQRNVCSLCNGNLVYCDDFDTYYCPQCNRWTEPTCHDPHCTYCRNRPETPLCRERNEK